MKNVIKTLDSIQTEEVRRTFLESVGSRIRDFREKKNISQTVLGQCLGLSPVSISNYENGVSDMKLSYLPLISLYCDVSISKLLPDSDMHSFINTLSEAISITVHRYDRISDMETCEDEFNYYMTHKSRAGMKEHFKKCDFKITAKPYSNSEVYDYVIKNKAELVPLIYDAGQILEYTKDSPSGDTLRNGISDFIIEEVFLSECESILTDERIRRLYAYYQAIYKNMSTK